MKNLEEQYAVMSKERKATKITTAFFINLLAELSEGRYTKGYVIMASEPSGVRKTNNPFVGRVKKISGWGFDLNADYSRKVNLQLQREGKEMDFEALPTYAEPVNKIVYRHKTDSSKLYMSVFPQPNFGTFVTYYVDNKIATAEQEAQILSFLPAKNDSSRQGTEKKIEIRRPLISNILSISLAGEKYELIENLSNLAL